MKRVLAKTEHITKEEQPVTVESKPKSMLKQFSSKNKCYKCGKELPSWWISAYCDGCDKLAEKNI